MFPTRSDTNRAVQQHKMARGLKIWIEEVEGLYYPGSENKGADQLRGYREADLRLCFRICKNRFSHKEANICTGPVNIIGSFNEGFRAVAGFLGDSQIEDKCHFPILFFYYSPS